VGGDVVDYTTKEVIQSKYLMTDRTKTLWDNIEKAAKQTMGNHKEFPPIDSKGREFKKVVEVRLDELLCGDLTRMSDREIDSGLKKRIRINGDLKGFDGLIRIRIGEKVMEFRVWKGNPGTSLSLQ
jgi:hypothetical protein